MSVVIDSTRQLSELLERLPEFQLPYTNHSVIHPQKRKSVTLNEEVEEEELEFLIPYGPKKILWYTFWEKQNGWFWLDLDRDRKITRAVFEPCPPKNTLPKPFFYGTVIYGTWLQQQQQQQRQSCNVIFVCEDILIYQGVAISSHPMNYRLRFWEEWLKTHTTLGNIRLSVPTMRLPGQSKENITILPKSHYNIHHIQYRSFKRRCPYRCIKMNDYAPTASTGMPPPSKRQKLQPQERVFQVRADIGCDLYTLTDSDTNASIEWAYIPNLITSKLMNGIFRRIRENINIDFIEESDDEDDMTNLRPDKYVDLDKTVWMTCMFSSKFKRWIPLREVSPPTTT